MIDRVMAGNWVGGAMGSSQNGGPLGGLFPYEQRAIEDAAEMFGGMIADPIDWIFTAINILSDPSDLSNYAGLLPIVPAGVGKAGKKFGIHTHHPLPKFLGGDTAQAFIKLDATIHREFHSILGVNLREAGIPLTVGGKGGAYADWVDYMRANPGAQRKAFDAVFAASRAIDAKHGVNVTQKVWQNIFESNFAPYP